MSMVPTECRMPSLYPELGRLQPQLILLAFFVGNGTLSQNAALIRRNLVRLIDKAVYEYSLARQTVLDQIAESQRSYEQMLGGRVIHMFGFTDHMENCLNATRRALDLLQHLRADLSAPAQDRIRRRLIESHAGSLIEVRNMFEHVGDAINNNEFGEGEMVILSYGDDQRGVCIGSNSLSFDSIATILRGIHEEARRLLEEPHPTDTP
ncbi:hypothetical protein [Stenotrophomonas sp. CFBP8994]|uniref:hypothetical protein n=1 Tax=Stenotrophomonas sp. CFBP8994 TaxID=3096527 RepID=UPI002A6B44DE|nr:hypothetical protein [Stenotrophomonas sp. CFBP8994]MDY0978967.1 hypothetical protein [Stenotrophomonas sp. CFBP8994]